MSAAPRAHARVLGTALALVGVLLVSGSVPASARTADRTNARANEPFRSGAPYAGTFADPTVLRLGGVYYAAATTVASLSLPMTTSRDLRTWVPRAADDPATPTRNDAMPTAAPWAQPRTSAGGRVFWPTWAPSLARVGPSSYVSAYAVPRATDGRRCIGVARSSRPLGPYVDTTPRPLACGVRAAIDPQIFRDRGLTWLLYKYAASPDHVVVRRMTASATSLVPGGHTYPLLTARERWEGHTVENPAMIRVHGRLYLFYSANSYATSRYATGYAICQAVTGPCTKMGRLLSTGSYLAGPGGATPFMDRAGRLRLAYHAWRTGNVGFPSEDTCAGTTAGCPQRRLYVAWLATGAHGKLYVRQRYQTR